MVRSKIEWDRSPGEPGPRGVARGAVGVALVAAMIAWPGGPVARAVDSGDPARLEDFESGLAEWTATGAGAGAWTTATDPQSPSPAKTVLRNADALSAAHAIYWSAVTATTTFSVRASAKGDAGGAWIGVTFGHDQSPDRYVAARVQVGTRTAEIVRFPEGQVLGSGQLPGSGGCGADPVVPANQYVTVEVQRSATGVVELFYNNMKLVSIQLPPDLLGGGHPGAYYAGGGASFDDLRIQSPDLPTVSEALVTVDAATTLGPVPEDLFGAFMVWLASGNGFGPAIADWDDLRDNVERLHQVFPMVADLGLRTLRFPGGTLANQYRWKEHIGNFLDRPPSAELTLDEFMRVAESLGARAVMTVNASDEAAGGPGTFEGAREAADLVEYLTAPDDGSNPDPDGLDPEDPDNVDWARARARNGHRRPYDVAGFEVGNELRGLPYLDGDPASTAYADRFIEFAGAMKAVNPSVLVGAVGKDNENDAQYAPWYEDVRDRLFAADCDWLPNDGTDVTCADFWIKHVYAPNYNIGSGDSIGVVFDSTTVAIERDFEVPAGAPTRLWFAAYATGSTGVFPLLRVEIDDGAALDETVEIDNAAPETHPAWRDMGLYGAGPATLAPGTHSLRVTRANGGRSLLLLPIVALADDAVGMPASWTDAVRVDLRDGTVLGRLEHAMATAERSRLLAPGATAPGELYDLPLWVTEISPSYEAVNIHAGVPESDYYVPPMDPEVGALREMLLDANLHMVMLDEGVGHATAVQLFDDRLGAGLVEGVGIDTHHGGEVGWDRIGSALPPRLRPRGWMMKELARHWRGDRVAVEIASP
ncbi:MAG: hypothetical protein KC466_15120, partial [Myxococcales bacterium]|nr:hypothetical protein [Myxococcales bacterium]